MSDTPIYDSLSAEYLRADKSLPWFMDLGRYKGQQIRILSQETTGIEWAPARSYLRDYLIQERYGMMVCTGKDNCYVCSINNVNPT